MMNLNKEITFLFTLALTILMPSCGTGNSSKESDLTVIKFEEAPESLKITDNFKNISCIQLEMTDNSVLGEIISILDVDDNIVVLTRDYEIWVFNRQDGKFIRNIGSVGEGPEEFITAKEICYDSSNNTILVFDALKREFISYKLTGEFVERFKPNGKLLDVHSIVRATDGTMMTCNNLLSEIPDQSAYSLILPDLAVEDIDPFAPVTQPKQRGSFVSKVWADKPMSVCGDEIKFVKVLTDTLCSVKNGKVTPLYKLDFGKELMTKEKVMEFGSWDVDALRFCTQNNVFPSVRNIFETSRFLVIYPEMEFQFGYYWIDKENGNAFHIDSTYEVEKEIQKVLQGKTITDLKASNKESLVSCFGESIVIEAFRNAISANRDRIALPDNVVSAIENLDPEGNPFLIIYSN